MARNTKLGNQTAMNDDITPETANVVETVENKIYSADRAMPIPRFFPIPPLTLRALRVTAISVMINAAIGEAKRLYHSVSNA